MKFIFILLLLGTFASSSAQKILDSVEVYEYPVRKGVIYNYDQNSLGCSGVDQIVTVLTTGDSLFHFEDGKIISVFNLGDCFVVCIRNSKEELITYSNLKTVVYKKGDIVNRGMFLGTIFKSDWGGMNEVDILIFEEAREMSFNRTINYIKCNISSAKEGELKPHNKLLPAPNL